MIAEPRTTVDPVAVLHRLRDATNRHDLDGLVACFADDYVSELPVHPSRDFRGRDQVRRNWAQILGGVPDLQSTLVRHAVAGSEQARRAVRRLRDGSPVRTRVHEGA